MVLLTCALVSFHEKQPSRVIAREIHVTYSRRVLLSCFSSLKSGKVFSRVFCSEYVDIKLYIYVRLQESCREGRKGLRCCARAGFALLLVRFCGNSYFNSRYCGFKTLSALRLLQPLSSGFRRNTSVCGDNTL